MTLSSVNRGLLLSLLLGWALSHAHVCLAQGDTPKEPSHAEKIRKALDQTMVIDFTCNSLQEAIDHLKTKARVNIVLDMAAIQTLGIFPIDDMGGVAGVAPIHLKSDRTGKVKTALQRMLFTFGLTYVIVDDSVLITTEEIGLHRQMRQRVTVDVKDQPLKDALKDLARTSGLNMIIDPRVAKTAQAPVTLEVDDATLETAVKLLAELGNLKAVRMGNVMFITSEDRAEKIRREESSPATSDPRMVPLPFGGAIGGGIGMVGPAGVIMGRGINQAVPGIAVPPGVPDMPPPPPGAERPVRPDGTVPPQRD